MAQPFDENRLELIGEPVPVAEQVASRGDNYISASINNILVYRGGGASQNFQATWFDHQGKALGTVGESGIYYGLSLSPKGDRAAVSQGGDIWLFDSLRGTNMRLTFGQHGGRWPTWSPDSSRLFFASNRDGVLNLFQKSSYGAEDEKLLLKSNEHNMPNSCSSNGRFLLYTAVDPKTYKADLWVLPLDSSGKGKPLLRTEFNEFEGRFSPDLRWVAYVSDESGINEIYVRKFSQAFAESSSEAGGKWLISRGGGTGPRWRRDGKELYYRALDGTVMVANVIGETPFQAGIPKPLFQAPPELQMVPLAWRSWDVAGDGSRFLLPAPAAESSSSTFTVILNWTALLRK